jgi:hypothetical protein
MHRFHETLKYWTCCANKKFTDFGDFEAFKGCQTAEEHDFSVAPKAVREDWFQTSSHVHLVLYGLRGARAAATRLQCKGGREVSALFADCEGNAFWTREWTLWAGVRARQSEVVLEATKAELRLKKAKEGQHWASFS